MRFHAVCFRCFAVIGVFLVVAVLPISCGAPPRKAATAGATPAGAGAPDWLFEDFEQPDPAVTWAAAASTQPASEPAAESQPATAPAVVHRSASHPRSGLWSLAASLDSPGTLTYTPHSPLDFSRYLQLTLPVSHTDAAGRNGEFTVSAAVIDGDGNRFESDAFPLLSVWEPIELDLRNARDLHLADIRKIEIILRRASAAAGDAPIDFQTDAWLAHNAVKKYIGERTGKLRTFFVESSPGQIRLGTVGQYEMRFTDRGSPAIAANPPSPAPWLAIFTAVNPADRSEDLQRVSLDRVLGEEGTGLALVDQSGLDALGSARRTDADDTPASSPSPPALPALWPGNGLARTTWQVAWSSPVAAMIEGTQEFGPYDRLGEPLVVLNWRFMVYQWGQAFVHVRWTKPGENAAPEPISWALITDPANAPPPSVDPLTTGSADAQERLLSDVYTAAFRQGLKSALPHRMQSGAPVTLIARPSAQKDNFWWAQASLPADPLARRRLMGAGLLPPNSPGTAAQADCMLLVSNPNALTRAGTFSQYLSPPKIVMRQGELDLTVPGDIDNDGFNEAYGFQAIRLSAGRAAFTIYPQNRPIFYPVCLFTVPAAERDALDVKHARLLVNIDGRQFADPPVFPDGSFLLQIPYVLNRPVTVEALLVKQ